MGRFGLTCHAGALTRLVSAQAGSRSTEARVETAGRNPKSNGQGLAVYFTGLIELFEWLCCKIGSHLRIPEQGEHDSGAIVNSVPG